jgi:hypothetical protein
VRAERHGEDFRSGQHSVGKHEAIDRSRLRKMTIILRFGFGPVTGASFARNLGMINAAHEND